MKKLSKFYFLFFDPVIQKDISAKNNPFDLMFGRNISTNLFCLQREFFSES